MTIQVERLNASLKYAVELSSIRGRREQLIVTSSSKCMYYDDVILNQSDVTLQVRSWTIESSRSFYSDMGGTIVLNDIKISHGKTERERLNETWRTVEGETVETTWEQNYCL